MATKIRILHVTSSLKIGGAETVLCTLLEQLPRDRFEHHVIYFHDGPMRARIEMHGIPLYPVSGLLALYDPFFWISLYSLIKQINPNHIHSLLWAANVASRVVARLLAIPVTSVYHNNVDQDGTLRNLLDRWTVCFAHALVAVSDDVADSLCANAPYIQRESVHVIKNGVDYHEITRIGKEQAVSRESLGFSRDHLVIGSVGRFVSIKNYPLLVCTFALLHANYPHARLVLVGQGPEERDLRFLVQKLGIADYVEFVVGQKASGYYPMFDFFVQSSDKEGVSIALLEAMSMGIPCIVTNRNYFHPVIKHLVNGILVPNNEAHMLMKAIEQVLCEHELRKRLIEQAYHSLMIDFAQATMVASYQLRLEMQL